MPFALATADYRFHVPTSAASTRAAWGPPAAGAASAASPPPPVSSLSPFPSFTSPFNFFFFVNLVPTPRQNNLQEVFVSKFHPFFPHPFLILSSLSLRFVPLAALQLVVRPTHLLGTKAGGRDFRRLLISAGDGRAWPLEHLV